MFCVGGIKSVGGLELEDGELGTLPCSGCVCQCLVWRPDRSSGPAASLTDDLQLARLARAAAVATAVVLLAVATGQAHCWGWEGVALAQSRSGGHTVNTQCSAVSLPASRQDCLSAPSIPMDKFTDIP